MRANDFYRRFTGCCRSLLGKLSATCKLKACWTIEKEETACRVHE